MSAPGHHAASNELVRSTFDAAASHFDDAPLFFWEQCGVRTVELACPRPGTQILDVCCGSGSSALASAESAGPTGHVVAVDLSENLLARAAVKAKGRDLSNIDFRRADMRTVDLPPASFDLVICVFGLYFLPDLALGIRSLWRMLKPGGMLAVTTWGRRALEPASRHYLAAVSAEWPSIQVTQESVSWARMNTPESLAEVFVAGGAGCPEVTEESLRQASSVESFWNVVLGSGYRIFLDRAGARRATRIRESFAQRMTDAGVDSVVADVLYARSIKA